MPQDITNTSLSREPQVKAFPNDKLQYVNIVTDGILINKFSRDQRAMVRLSVSVSLSVSLLNGSLA
jgi:hypothetical protein